MILKMKATNVYKRHVEAKHKYKITCHEGGSRSSKTFSIFQDLIISAMNSEFSSVTIARSKLTWVKTTLLKDFAEICEKYQIDVFPAINPNRSDQIYYINGVEFAFFGLDYPQKLHGRKQDIAWLNEVMEIDKKSFDQMEMRTTMRMIIDYNPSDDTHWVFDLQKRPDVTVIKSTMLDNPFLEETIRNKILSYDPNNPINITNATADAYMWEVYGRGNKARMLGAVFEHWDIVNEIPDYAKFIADGMDYGYTNDPTVLLEVYKANNNHLYVNELIYETGLTNDDIAKRMKTLGITRSVPIYPDSAEPKSNEELRRHGFMMKQVTKGPDSVNFGISILKEYHIHITRRSINLENELRKYKWVEDKNGKMINKPIDEFNHAIDALRYVALMVLKKRNTITLSPAIG